MPSDYPATATEEPPKKKAPPAAPDGKNGDVTLSSGYPAVVAGPPQGDWNPAPILKQILETPVPGIPSFFPSQDTNKPNAPTWNPAPVLKQVLETPVIPKGKEPGEIKIPGSTEIKEGTSPSSKEFKIPGSTEIKESQPTASSAPPPQNKQIQIPGSTEIQEAQPPTAIPTPAPTPPQAVPQPQAQQPPQALTAPMPSGTGAGAPQALPADPYALHEALVEQGLITPGQAQAVIAGQIPKTLAGKTPPPPAVTQWPTPSTTSDEQIRAQNEQALAHPPPTQPEAQQPAALAPITPQDLQRYQLSTFTADTTPKDIAAVKKLFAGPGKVQMRDDGTVWWAEPDGTATEVGKESDIRALMPKQSGQAPAPSGSTTEQPKTIEGGNIKGRATIFGLNYDGSIDTQDNGVGFFGGVNTRNPKLKAVAVPVDVLEATFGHFTHKQADGTYAMLATPEARDVVRKIVSAHVNALGTDGKVHSFPIVDIQGSLKGHPGNVLDLTLAASRELGFNDNHSVSYQIVGGDGKPYAIPADQLAGWNSEKGGGKAGEEGDTSSPQISLPGGGNTGGRPQAPSGEGYSGSGGASTGRGAQRGGPSEAGSVNFYPGGFGWGGGGGEEAPPQKQPTKAAVPPPAQQPSTALLPAATSGTVVPYSAAAAMPAPAPMKQANVLGVRTVEPPPAPGAPAQLPASKLALNAPPPAPSAPAVDPSVIKGLMQQGFTKQQAIDFALKATVVPKQTKPAKAPPSAAPSKAPQKPTTKAPLTPTPLPTQQAPAQIKPTPPPPAPEKPPSDLPPPPEKRAPKTQVPAITVPVPEEPTEFTGAPAGSTRGNPTPKGHEAILQWPRLREQAEQHASILSPDDPRVKKQPDGYIKGEHFVEGDPFHESVLSGLPYGKQGRQRQLLGHTEQAIADESPMHISYISSPQEAEKFPTRESRKIQYDKHSPEARLMGTTEGQLVGHSLIPLSVGVKLSKKASEPHESYIQGISTNILANNFQHINDKLQAMGRKTPYEELGPKFYHDLEGYYHNLLAGHTATGKAYAVGTEDHPNEPDREHVPYKLTRKEADFIGAVINNTAAFAGHEDAKAIRELARANGTLITEKGETNRLLHEIEQLDPGWSGRGSGKRGRVLEPSIRSFKTGLIHEIHPSEEHLPATIRPGKEYQQLTKAIARTSERGRPDIAIAASLHHTFQDNAAINKIEREFSEDKITEQDARARLQALGEDPDDYRFVSGSGGLITPYEDDPEALTPEEHTQMKDNLRKQWVGGKMNVEDYRRKAAEVPLPSKPSKPAAAAPAPAVESAEPETPEETPKTPPAAPKPLAPTPKPKPAPKAPPEPVAKPEEAPEETAPAKPQPQAPKPPPEAEPEESEEPAPAPATPPAPDEPLPVKPIKPVKATAPAPAPVKPAKLPKLVKPKDANKEWKGVPEAEKQAYLEEKVRRTLASQIQDKATHKLEVQRNEDGSVKYDPNGSPVYVKHDYDIANAPMLKKKALGQIKNADDHEDTLGNLIGPDGKEVIDPETGKPVLKHAHLNQVERRRLSAMHTASAVHTMGDKIFDSYKEAIKNPDIAAGEGWYSRMRKRLGDALGEHHELFAQLLGATSAKTPVRTNFINALDAFEQYREGKFNKHIEKFLEAHGKLQDGEGALTQHMRDLGILKKEDPDHESDADAMAHWIKHHDILPISKKGSKYSANSNAVLKVLAGTWLKEVGAPKTPNFAGNLTGRTLEATIDVWAARHLQRLGYEGHMKGPWRAQSAAEPGVSNMDFAFSQDAMRHAADRISKETGKQMNPDDLQAILWFAEKHHYEDRGWTRGQGAEKSSFDDVADRVFGKDGQPHEKPMDSEQLRAHYQAEAKALQQRKGKIETAQSYLGTPREQTKLPAYMQKHGLTHEEIHGTGPEEEEEAA